jgi:hypothetical protein
MFDQIFLPELTQSPLYSRMRAVPEQLYLFCGWYFDGGAKLKPPQDGILHQERLGTLATSVVLFREGAYQVELITFGPNTTIPRHRHDHIDSIEVMVSGALDLWVDDVQCVFERSPRPQTGMNRDVLKFVPIPSDAYHHGRTVGGGSFLSVQRWKGMSPTHVGIEWQDPSNLTFEGG